MKQSTLSFFLCFLSFLAIAQKKITGTVFDYENKQPLPFVNITLNNNPKWGTISDIDGHFEIETSDTLHLISFSYVGYEKKEISYKGKENYIIAMVPTNISLNEVVLQTGENPAHRIIKKVIENKDLNNPEKMKAFSYHSYNKTVFDFKKTHSKEIDSSEINNVLKGGHIFMMEAVSERKFLYPNSSEEVVIGTRVSGFKHPNFASLASDLQPFSFYNDQIPLFDIHYLNPIAKGSLKKYNFKLEDEFYVNNDTLFVISYQPKNKKNIEGLKGILHINSNGYAVQNVTATPFEKGKIDLTIQQKYQQIDNQWFPEQLNYILETTTENEFTLGMIVKGRSYINHVILNPPLEKKNFSIEKVRLEDNAALKDSIFWKTYRPEVLNDKEKTTYNVLDSLGQKFKFDRLLLFTQKLTEGKIPFGKIDLDLNKTLKYNRYEGFRLGSGIITSESFSKKITLGAFAGYGLKDYKWKYGGFSEYEFSKKNEIRLGVLYQNELNDIGNYGIKSEEQKGLKVRNYLSLQMDQIRNYAAYFSFRLWKYSTWKIKSDFYSISPTYEYTFLNNDQATSGYKNAQISLYIRWVPNEKIIQSFNRRVHLKSSTPLFKFYFSNGIKGFQNSNFNYHKMEASVEQTFYSKNFGTTHYKLELGNISNNLPLGLLFTGEGSYVKKYPYFIKDTFQTMQLNEFVSDQYANVFIHHNFESLLLKIKKFQPRISLHQNVGWGNLKKTNNHLGILFKTKEKIYLESGLQVENILKMDYLNVGYLGFGGSLFYRYGAYSLPELKDNIVLKFNMTITIK